MMIDNDNDNDYHVFVLLSRLRGDVVNKAGSTDVDSFSFVLSVVAAGVSCSSPLCTWDAWESLQLYDVTVGQPGSVTGHKPPQT